MLPLPTTMKNLTKFLQNENAAYHMWDRGSTLIVAVSGGRDSMCLLDLLIRLQNKEDLTLIVAHVNYGLRGSDSDDDEALVRAAAMRHSLRCEVLTVDPSRDSSTPQNEALWRSIRYDFFESMARNHSAHAIAVGHHAHDQAETLLLHLLRGTGLKGLAGMQSRSMRGNVSLIRPLLHSSRDDIDEHCKKFSLRYRDDSSNTDTTLLRNKIRHELLPNLAESYNPNIIATLAQTATNLFHDESQSLPPHFWHTTYTEEMTPQSISFSRETFLQYDFFMQNILIRHFASLLRSEAYSPNSSLGSECIKAIVSTKSKVREKSLSGLILTCNGDIVELTLP